MSASAAPVLPATPPFAIRARLLTPLNADGATRYEPDAVIEVDASGRITSIEPWEAWTRVQHSSTGQAASTGQLIDLRPWVLLPGMVDLHVHLPQVPAAGFGAGLDLLTWLRRYIFPLEQAFDEATAERVAPRVFRAMAAAGTTTAVMYGAIWAPSLDASFRAAEAHGIRAVIGKVMMDELTYDDRLPRDRILETSLQQSADLCQRWHGRDNGRLRYAFTPRFAVSCSGDMLRESAALARSTGAYWQTHIAEDRGEIAEVARRFPDARDYLDVYDRAGALGERTILAHAIYLSDRELDRLVESGSRIAHCPESNLFLASGLMPLARYRRRGAMVGLGSDVAAGPALSLFEQMRIGFYAQNALHVTTDDPSAILDPLDWLRMGTLDGARMLGLDAEIGSLEVGKEADLIAVDAALTEPLPGVDVHHPVEFEGPDQPSDLMSRLMFRAHPEMVRGAWVRGRLLQR